MNLGDLPKIIQESYIEFDFSRAIICEKHDAKHSYWPGVDYEIQEPDGGWIWLEVKNWEPPTLPSRYRGGQRRAFLAKMKSGVYFSELREKFLGASAFLTLTKTHPQTWIRYVIVLESPRLRPEILQPLTNRMQSLIPRRLSKKTVWPIGIDVAVLNVAEWNRRFPEYPAKIL